MGDGTTANHRRSGYLFFTLVNYNSPISLYSIENTAKPQILLSCLSFRTKQCKELRTLQRLADSLQMNFSLLINIELIDFAPKKKK